MGDRQGFRGIIDEAKLNKTKPQSVGTTSGLLINPLNSFGQLGDQLMNILPDGGNADKSFANQHRNLLLDKDLLIEGANRLLNQAVETHFEGKDDTHSRFYKDGFSLLIKQNAETIFSTQESPIETLFFSSLLLHSANCLRPIIVVPISKNAPQDIKLAKRLIEESKHAFDELISSIGLENTCAYLAEEFGKGGIIYLLLNNMGENLSEVMHVFMQAGLPNIGKGIRVDALAWLPSKRQQFVVECDGFEFHSSNKAFVSDRQRDRKLQSQGYRILRFSGSEIYNNPMSTPTELVNFVFGGVK